MFKLNNVDVKQVDCHLFLQQEKKKKKGLFWISIVLQFSVCNPGKPHAGPAGQGKNSFIEGKRKLGGLP